MTGAQATVEYAYRNDGTSEAKQWLESQEKSLRMSFGTLFDRLCSNGRIFNEQQFRHLGNQVWEFKRDGHRLLCFRTGKRFLLTHRIKKAGGIGKCPPAEIQRAETIGLEHIAWESKASAENKRKRGNK